jgi:hypothetical protein
LPVIDRDKTVFSPAISNAGFVHLPGQPFPSVQAEVDSKRKPALDPGMHEAKNGMEKVMIEEKALPHLKHQMDLFSLALTTRREGLAGFNRRKDHD